ncbi:MAG TPA: 6-pyruvoyl-tetrahydropterin synthase-related protein, partial [Pyrinomonadaceae bacterium]|nr:6-pyruvoyl-tetrahydropterin synthase-related protein [Pyrinomonadaceae bacterium]
GYGGIGLRFYPPTAYYVLAFGKILMGDWFTASCLAFLFWTILGGFGVYFLAREFADEKSAFVGAVLYLFAPYHATELYGAFMYAEFAAAAILPFCFLFLTRIINKNNVSDIFGLAISIAALIFTHLPLSVIGILSFAVYTLFALKKENFFRLSAKVSLGVLLALAASSFQWIKVLTEMKWLNHASEKFSAADFYDYRENFLLSFKYLAGLENDIHSMWFFDLLLLFTLIIALPFAVVFYKNASIELKNKLKSAKVLAIFTFFIFTPLSILLWNYISVLQKVQFPWRFLSVFTICAVVFVASGFEIALSFAKTKQRPIFLMLCGCLFVGIAFTYSQVIKQALFIPPNEFVKTTENLASAPNHEEWLSVWAKKEAAEIGGNVLSARKNEIKEWNSTKKVFKLAEGKEETARIGLFYYPHWQAEINGLKAEIKPAEDGAMLVKIPAQESIVKLEFVEPKIVKISIYVSILSWIFLIAAFLQTRFKFI